jgi:hypothetical protein
MRRFESAETRQAREEGNLMRISEVARQVSAGLDATLRTTTARGYRAPSSYGAATYSPY